MSNNPKLLLPQVKPHKDAIKSIAKQNVNTTQAMPIDKSLLRNNDIPLISGIILLCVALIFIILGFIFFLMKRKRGGYTKLPHDDDESEEQELADFTSQKHFYSYKESDLYNAGERTKLKSEAQKNINVKPTIVSNVFAHPVDATHDNILSDDSYDHETVITTSKECPSVPQNQEINNLQQQQPVESMFSISGIRQRILVKTNTNEATVTDGFVSLQSLKLRRTSSTPKMTTVPGLNVELYKDFARTTKQNGCGTSSTNPTQVHKIKDEEDEFFVDEKMQNESDAEDEQSILSLDANTSRDDQSMMRFNAEDKLNEDVSICTDSIENTFIENCAVPNLVSFNQQPGWLRAPERANPGLIAFSLCLKQHRKSKSHLRILHTKHQNDHLEGKDRKMSKLATLDNDVKSDTETGTGTKKEKKEAKKKFLKIKSKDKSKKSVVKSCSDDDEKQDDDDDDLKISHSWVDLVLTLHQVRCIFGGHVNPIAGRFYVKVRLLPADIKPSLSILSLTSVDQLSSKFVSPFDKAKRKLIRRKNEISKVEFPKDGVVGRLPMCVAFRSLVYERKVRLKLPKTWFFEEEQVQEQHGHINNVASGENVNTTLNTAHRSASSASLFSEIDNLTTNHEQQNNDKNTHDFVKTKVKLRETPSVPRLILQLDLKEFPQKKVINSGGGSYLSTLSCNNAVVGEGLERSRTGKAYAFEGSEWCLGERKFVGRLPMWKKATTVASVRVPFTPAIWHNLMQGLKANMESHGSIDEAPTNEKQSAKLEALMAIRKKTVCLRFMREWTTKFEGGTGSRGCIDVGLQYIPEQGKLTVRIIKCSDIIIPKGNASVFIRASLVTNNNIIATRISQTASKLSLHTAEFCPTAAGSAMTFTFEKHVEHVCLILCIMASSASNTVFNNLVASATAAVTSSNQTEQASNKEHSGNDIALSLAKLVKQTGLGEAGLIGRCAIGPPGLAYGSGENHWLEITTKRGLIRQNHVLI